MMKRILFAVILPFSFLALNAQVLHRKLIVPEWANQRVKMYTPTSYPNADANYTIDLSGLCSSANPNGVTVYENDLFVTVSSGGCQRIYRYPDYLTNPSSAIVNSQMVTNYGNDYVGLLFDASGNLYTTEGSYGDNQLVRYAASNNYAAPPEVLGNAGLTSYLANMAFDAQGNLWVSDYLNHRIVVFDANNLNTIHTHRSITTISGGIVTANTVAAMQTNTQTVFSNPEGIAFDAEGNLWVANNNNEGANPDFTSLVKISKAFLDFVVAQPENTFFNLASVGNNGPNQPDGYSVYNVPNSGSGHSQLGGLQIDKSIGRIYVTEQKSGQGFYFDLATVAGITATYANYALPITTTNPGNGGLFLQHVSNMGINEKVKNVCIYPNPAQEYVVISGMENVKAIYALVDISGKVISEYTFSGSSVLFPLSQVSDGYYVLYRNGAALQKILIQH